ncbi:MAG TPA: hypothetical protein VMR33_21510 [Candidatus Baltobacteraceae bacterium]|nr:hypothetical protein [Candidatus Baltobacteraceae bacterium]
MKLMTGKEAEEAKQTKASAPMLENPEAYGVKVKFSNGRHPNSLFLAFPEAQQLVPVSSD